MSKPRRVIHPRIGAVAALSALLAACNQATIVQANVSPDGMTVGIGIDTCNADLQTSVEESAEEVRITVTASNGSTDDCLDSVQVRLSAPLGDRALIANGEALEPIIEPDMG